MKLGKKDSGITLVSLVVTIIVIIIISSITISVTFGENGIIKKAGLTKDLASNFIEEENGDMNRVMSEHANVMGGNGGIPEPEEDTIPPIVSIVVGEVTKNSIQIMAVASDSGSGLADTDTYKYYINGEDIPRETTVNNSYTFTELTAGIGYSIKVEAFDKLGNRGEASTTVSTKKVETIAEILKRYKVEYNTEVEDDFGNKVWIPGGFGIAKDSGTKVEEGVVIEDTKGNQFVWIPVGEYKVSTSINATGKLKNNLTRRKWPGRNVNNKPTEIKGDSVIETYFYGEGDSRSIAKDTINKFKASATEKGGFYIGRYEQGINNVCMKNIEPYVDISKSEANSKGKEMYSGNNYVTSELISSYAWDTALNFICQTNTARYKLATTTDNTYGNMNTQIATKTGEYKVNGKESDKYSNIYDIIGNRSEWTTEYCSRSNYPWNQRGAEFNNSSYYAAVRQHNNSSKSSNIGFRVQLYIK